jgi:ParB/RepB/Spo0J family partition protein
LKTTQILTEAPRELLLDALRIAPWNARKTFDPASLRELSATIQKQGLISPLIVRPVNGGKYEIVAGHRRFQVTLELGWKSVPCFVRELTEDQAHEIALVDNLQREDIPALEEADAYKELQQRLGTPAAIAARVGKEVSYVARRLQLVSLAEMPRKALAERLITVDHALLLARLGGDEQDVNLKWALNPNSGIKEPVATTIAQRTKELARKDRYQPWEPQSPVELKHHIEQNVGRKLSRAPWDLEDAELLPAAGACNVCPSNTKANDTLFGDMAIAAATCENGACFEQKREAFVQLRLGSIPERHDLPGEPTRCLRRIKLSWKSTTVKPRMQRTSIPADRDGFAPEQVFKYGQWIDAKPKSCEFLRQGVTVDWSDAGDRGYMGSSQKASKPGQILAVCIAEKCKVHKKGYSQPDRKANGQRYDAKADEAKREQQKQAAIAESKLRLAVASKAIEGIKALPAEVFRELVLGALRGGDVRVCNAIVPGFDKVLKTAKIDSPEFVKAAALVSIADELEASPWNGAESGRKEFLAAVKRLGYDGSSAWLKPAEPKPEKALPAKKLFLSAEARKRIADAQRKRWATAKKAGRK